MFRYTLFTGFVYLVLSGTVPERVTVNGDKITTNSDTLKIEKVGNVVIIKSTK